MQCRGSPQEAARKETIAWKTPDRRVRPASRNMTGMSVAAERGGSRRHCWPSRLCDLSRPEPVLSRPKGSTKADRKSTRLNPVTNAHLVCRLLLEKKKHTS